MNIARHLAAAVLLVCLVIPAVAQIGGDRVYEFVNLPASARVTGAGGSYITVMDDDISLAYHNPSLLNPSMHNRLSASTAIYFAGSNYGNFNYVRSYKDIGTFQTGIQYITYGKFDRTDVTGAVTGDFTASEYALNVGGAHPMDKYSFGGNLKFVFSQFDSYRSYGAALDLAATYNDTAKLFTATFLVKNIGGQFKPYRSGNREPIPFEIQAGFSKRFKNLPFRVSVIVHNLQNFRLRYDDPNQTSNDFVFGDTTQSSNNGKNVIDEIARHFILSGEFYFGKVVTIGFGYNHLRRQEMKVSTKRGLAGFSFSVGLDIKQFYFGFARARQHIAKASNHFTVAVNLNEFVKKK